MKDFTKYLLEDDVPLCPLCDQPIVYMMEEAALGMAHDAVFLAHQVCVDERIAAPQIAFAQVCVDEHEGEEV